MIRGQKLELALRALQLILTRARWMANESNQPDIAELLDRAEILPDIIVDKEDRTEDYRTALVGIADRFPRCSHAVVVFDGNDVGNVE